MMQVTGNSSWMAGIVPENEIENEEYLFRHSTAVGLNNSGTAGGNMTKEVMHEKRVVMVVDFTSGRKELRFDVEGKHHIMTVPSDFLYPLRLCIAGFSGTIVTFEDCLNQDSLTKLAISNGMLFDFKQYQFKYF